MAGRGRDEAQSPAATIRQRRPSDQLTPSHRLDGEHVNVSTSARSPTTPVDTQSAAAHTRTAARQLARPASPTHTRTHKVTSVHFVGLTLGLTVRQLLRLLGYFHLPTQLSFLSSVLIILCLGDTTTVSQFINSTESFHAAVSQTVYRDSHSDSQGHVRTLRRTHTRTHSPTTSTTIGLLSFTHSAQLLELSSNYTVSRLHDNRLTVY